MGAEFNIDQAVGVTMRDAYQNAVDDAHYQYGHDPYNGTISTTHGFVDVTKLFNSMSEQEFEDTAFDNIEKWGDAWGVRLGQREGSELSHYRFYYWGAV